MRVVIWHGYLLHGTGSNEFSRGLARTLASLGHDVVVLSQDPDPGSLDLAGAGVGRPGLPGRLPVFVLDRYADMEPALLPTMARAELDAFVSAQVRAIAALGPADLLISNHALLGGPVGAASGLPYVVKVHGSELEYAMRGNAGLCRWAAETLAPARAVVVGSAHIGAVVTDLIGALPAPVEVITPGVDVVMMAPEAREAALDGLLHQSTLDPDGHVDERLPDLGNAARLEAFLAGSARPTVVYVGKLSREKGVHLLLDALPGLGARAVVVGFGPARAELEAQAARLGVRVLFTGPLAHRHLRHLWALADASVVPSVFPEAFGMVAAEAAATGCPPVVARHSGLAEVAAGLEAHLPDGVSLGFARDDAADLHRVLGAILELAPEQRAAVSVGVREAVLASWSWEHVARRFLAAGLRSPGIG
ncbi:MAG: glycosyltransferase family 4 protein [Candidatus Nanopelagicales bacterium]